jgi:hypothetical protein
LLFAIAVMAKFQLGSVVMYLSSTGPKLAQVESWDEIKDVYLLDNVPEDRIAFPSEERPCKRPRVEAEAAGASTGGGTTQASAAGLPMVTTAHQDSTSADAPAEGGGHIPPAAQSVPVGVTGLSTELIVHIMKRLSQLQAMARTPWECLQAAYAKDHDGLTSILQSVRAKFPFPAESAVKYLGFQSLP